MLIPAQGNTRQIRHSTPRRAPDTTPDVPGHPVHPAYGGQIDISDIWEAFYWCNSLGCTFEELRMAVKLHGTSATAVRAHFEEA